MINRRKFLEAGAAVGVGAMLPLKVASAAEKMTKRSGAAMPPGGGGSPPLTKFLPSQEVPNPLDPSFIYKSKGSMGGVRYYEIPINAFAQPLHPELKGPTPLWGYGGTFPSRTIEVNRNEKIRIRWINTLRPTDQHPVASAIDYLHINGMGPTGQKWPPKDFFPVQRISTHLHGGHVPWTSDGGPSAWYTGPYFGPNGQTVIYDGYNNGDTFDYPNNQFGTTLWFHDHAMGITRLNVYAGMAGFWILRDPGEGSVSDKKRGSLNLPFGKYEIPLAIQDRTFTSDGSGQLFYPAPPEVPEFFGDTMLVNGKVWPICTVEPRKYRFRLLNGCNARFLRMQLVQSDAAGTIPITTRQWVNYPFVQIGAEGGFFDAPTAPFNTLLMAPAERADVIIDFAAVQRTGGVGYVLLYNDAATPFGNTQDTRGAIPQIMLFKVAGSVTDNSNNGDPTTYVLPKNFNPNKFISDATALTPSTGWKTPDGLLIPRRFKELDEITVTYPDGVSMLMQLINRVGYLTDPAGNTVDPDIARIGDTEVWEIINTTVDVHPIHLHQTMFQVVNRQPFSVSQYLAKAASGPTDPTPYLKQDQLSVAGPNEQGWKDTVRANPGEVTRIAMRWADYTGNYVYHCHILEHEEHDMMRALEIVGP